MCVIIRVFMWPNVRLYQHRSYDDFLWVVRDVQLKGLRHSTDQAPLNCSTGKYLNSPIKLESPDSNLARLGSVGFMPRRDYKINTASDHVLTTQHVRQNFLHTLGVVKNGSEITLWQVPARPTDQQVLPTRPWTWLLGCFVSQPRP